MRGVRATVSTARTKLDYHVIPSFFIGVLGIVVAARLTASTGPSAAVVDPAPVRETRPTAALCLACLVPRGGLVIVLLHRAFLRGDPIPDFLYGTYGTVDRFVITIVVPVIACAGGPLLGVAVGRWLRFPGAPLLAVIVVLFWSNVAAYVPEQAMDADSLLARILHMVGPYTAFGQGNGDGEPATTVLQSFTGSPFWFAVWSLALCGLAVTAALWRGAEGETRRTVRRAMVVLASAAVLALTLSVATGNQALFETNPQARPPSAGSGG